MKKDIIRVAFVGAGQRGPWLLKQLSKMSDVRVLAVCDKHEDRTQKMKEIVARKGGQNAKLECSDPTCEIENMDSVLLPAWFVVFHHDGESYTIMVNGQTGKVVGAVPFDKKKAGIIFAGASAILSVLCIEILLCCSYVLKDDSFGVYIIFFFCGLLFWEFARRRWKKYKYGQDLTKEVEIQEFSKKRGGNE